MKDNCQKLQEQIQASKLVGSQLITYPVTEKIILAGQPAPEDWERLAQQGYELIINVRSDPERAAYQAEKAHATGLRYVHLDIPAYELETEHIQAFQSVLAGVNEGKVLLHCRTASRVALLWMLHRMVNDGWSRETAETELQNAGYGEDDMDVFRYCTDDFLERETTLELIL